MHEALAAADLLAEEGISARVIDLYSIKPLDARRSSPPPKRRTADRHGRGPLPEGGLGEAVLSAFADADERPHVVSLAVRELPSSGKPEELLAAGIDADHIAAAARQLVAERSARASR